MSWLPAAQNTEQQKRILLKQPVRAADFLKKPTKEMYMFVIPYAVLIIGPISP
ncbi:MAG: hypothetical protein V4543_13110 [Bacteroidota bacterium]